MWNNRSLGQIAGPPAFTPAPSDSTNLQPLPQPPLPQILQEPDFKELDDLEGYNKFADVLQLLNSFEIDDSIGQNKNVKKLRIKYDDWKITSLMFQKNGYMFSFDLKSGYHHIEIFQPHQTFLGFSWDFQGVTRYNIFTILPFGLLSLLISLVRCSAPWSDGGELMASTSRYF